MRFASSLIGIALSCVIQGRVIDHIPRDSSFGYGTMTFSTDDFCTNQISGHVKPPSKQIPLVGDCKKLMDHFNESPKYGFELFGWGKGHMDSGYAELGKQGSCALGVKLVDDEDGPPAITMGDAAWILKLAMVVLPGLKDPTHVEGVGTTSCQPPVGESVLQWTHGWSPRKFQWQIYYPGTQNLIDFSGA
ncbi:hypothetical protein F5Y10DRAFT_245914 [Nemania abortiva]|nr:hypothetical protein F5Y10DRAFT_245914 [Nemania abortiva]